MSTAYSLSSTSLNATPCAAAITGWETRAGTLIEFWKSRIWLHVKGAQRPGSVCCGSVWRLVVVPFSQFLFRGGKGAKESL